jgi:hypothetical protein
MLTLVLGLLLGFPYSSGPHAGEFDFERDRVVLQDGRELRGVVLQRNDPEVLVLLRPGKRELIPLTKVARVDTLRDRLAAFLRIRRPGLSLASEWELAMEAHAAGLERTARLQAFHVLLRDPQHAEAHAFLGHCRWGSDWKWDLDGKRVSAKTFLERSLDWNHRLVLESEHFTLETDCGLARALECLFDLEAVYVWYLEHLGPLIQATEDVDAPNDERIAFQIHPSREDPNFQQLTSVREPYYEPELTSSATGSANVVRTYYADGHERPERLFELATEAFLYSTLVLGRTIDEADYKIRRLSHWAEVGLGAWIALHCAGPAGFVTIRKPFEGGIALDPATARASLEAIRGPHVLNKGRSELTNLVDVPFFELVGAEASVPLVRARAASFVAYLIEVDPPLAHSDGTRGARDALWRYFREIYGTQAAYAAGAFTDGLAGTRIDRFEADWKAWTARFTR